MGEAKKRKDVRVFKLTRNNRDQIFPQVYEALRKSLALGEPGTTKAAIRRREKMEALKKEEERKQKEAEEKERERLEKLAERERKEKKRAARAKIEAEKRAQEAALARQSR